MSLNLTAAGLADQKAWEAAGYALPSYDREAMITRTKESPCWVHFGAGNIFRAFQANTAQELLNNGTFDRGVIVAEGFDTEIIRDMYQPHDNLSILVTLKTDGSVEKTVVGSIAESLAADTGGFSGFCPVKRNLYQGFPADGDVYDHRKGIFPEKRCGRTAAVCCCRFCCRTFFRYQLYGKSCFSFI